jgi:protein Mpv17
MSVCLARQLLVAPTTSYLAERWQARMLVGGSAQKVFSSSSSASSKSSSLMAWYEHHLTTRPLPTKMITGCSLWGIGDIVAQSFPYVSAAASSSSSDSNTSSSLPPFQWDAARTGRAAFFGFVLHAPTSHVHYNFLEWMTQKLGLTGLAIPIFKTIMEQFVYWSWISNSMYHGAMGLLEGQSPALAYQRIEDRLWETQIAQWKFWIPFQLVNFQFTPVRHQLNVVLITSIGWTALLSMWYPPTATTTKVVAAAVTENKAEEK